MFQRLINFLKGIFKRKSKLDIVDVDVDLSKCKRYSNTDKQDYTLNTEKLEKALEGFKHLSEGYKYLSNKDVTLENYKPLTKEKIKEYTKDYKSFTTKEIEEALKELFYHRPDRDPSNPVMGIGIIVDRPEQIKEDRWFKKANDLVAEFVGSEPVISSSRFGSWDETAGDVDYDGKVIIPEQQKPIEAEEEIFSDDVDLLKKDPNFAHPNIPQTDIYILSAKDFNLSEKDITGPEQSDENK